ncbi:hypothetical protein LCGC14_0560340 [marine sediment metagenome]|uniref:GTP cyclohydrolase I n=1 Tax=marine sediment metagenome TaxID=412755 RepID=A0A0F9U8T0_9ZZZZ
MDKRNIKNLFQKILEEIEGTNLRDGLKETPKRIANMFGEIFEGYSNDPDQYIKLFKGKYDEVIISKNIEFYSMCMHHIIPFFGTVDIVYLPNETILGISKLARIVDHFAHRLNIQEKMTVDIANFLMGCELKPLGVMVIIKATHLCEVMRGVKKNNPIMITSAIKGIFFDNPVIRSEALVLLNME